MAEYFPVPTWEDYEVAKKNGISRKNVDQRVQYLGWAIERAITTPVLPKRNRPKYMGYAELAEKNGIPYKTFVERVNGLRWSLEQAANTPVREKTRLFLHNSQRN
ncbi:hypothetical protein [Bacillus wiedmannii]|uniref:hypothetical protein n=1 Tax=Bacillus wiedmannii TaxID=1890302 RepID=UPI0025A0C13B|nr:hypothetical protein [Bacillus wiedmannii]MDM5270497.1 hypothetical protein [Bacillus wiedmannii]